ncbi:hypothetical protein EJ04DRAFT_565947 [Polyplosphaeria fusca]|uniref:Uncharacterized protein n=1 Tax=Polyplosphaeria fusca TaxID=682080 RepID=A0A9P4QWC5_9PLEO|nr:hypothetical protein EJ04DRAFT_565947 [Polyplosphaeria fusca]
MTDKVTRPRARKKREAKSRDPLSKAAAQPDALKQRAGSATVEIVQRIKQEPIEDLPQSPPVALRPYWASYSVGNFQGSRVIDTIRSQWKLPFYYEPSKAEFFDHAFISHFVELNRSVRPYNTELPWVAQVPGLHTKATKPALKLSLRAACMAFYAQVHQDAAILTDSYRWYTRSLTSQRQALSRLGKNAIPDDEEILVPIILGLYEVYAGTTPTSVFQHLTAATRIFQLRGPSSCITGVGHVLLRAIRTSDSHKAVIFNEPSILSTQEWMTVPFSVSAKNGHQTLTDIILQIPSCTALCGLTGNLGDIFVQQIPDAIDLRHAQRRTAELIQELEDWGNQYPHLCTRSDGPMFVSMDMSIPSAEDPGSPSLVLPDTFVALTAATYKATRLILTLLQNKISPNVLTTPISLTHSDSSTNSPSPDAIASATLDAQSILDITLFLETNRPVGMDFMRSIFPLVLVASLGPGVKEQQAAKKMLTRWGTSRGVGGLCGAWKHP